MKSTVQYPFERNNYYHSMLLTEKDLMNEQTYMNDKRRTINRFLLGSGVAAGMNVLRLDEKNISLESGIALDETGREIVVDRARIFKLSQINGFDQLSDSGQMYLCIRYAEKKTEFNSVCHMTDIPEEEANHRVQEGYELYLTNRSLEDRYLTSEYFIKVKTVLYQDREVRVTQSLPRFIRSGMEFNSTLCIESLEGSADVELHLTEALSCLHYDGKEVLDAVYRVNLKKKGDQEEFKVRYTTFSVGKGNAEMRVSADKTFVTVNGKRKDVRSGIVLKVPVTSRSLYEEYVDFYYADFMDHAVLHPSSEDIYLAKIDLNWKGNDYQILKVANNPYDQRVYSSFLLKASVEALKYYAEHSNENLDGSGSGDAQLGGGTGNGLRMSSGEVRFELPVGARQGQKIFSEDIFHGLGLGPVTIELSMENEMMQLSGSTEIFDELPIKAEMATLTDMTKGSFKIGVRMLEATAEPEFKVHWTAFRDPSETGRDSSEKDVRIIPDKLELKVLQNYYLKAEVDNMPGAVVLWEVVSEQGGTVSRDGLYTAPDVAGVYEVSAFIQESPGIRDSIFIIVRD